MALDIETAPMLADVWVIWETNVGLNQIRRDGYILSFASKWIGKPGMTFTRVYHDSAGRPNPKSNEDMLRRIHALLDEADVVLTYNGKNFDVRHINAQFAKIGMLPPSPFKHIDLMISVKKEFHLPSYKLEYVANFLGVGRKVKHQGHELWVKCMAEDRDAWTKMERYNKHDVTLLEGVYRKMLPWIRDHPNYALYLDETRPVCPNCGSRRLQKRGGPDASKTAQQVYQRYACMKCGTWIRDAKKMAPHPKILTRQDRG